MNCRQVVGGPPISFHRGWRIGDHALPASVAGGVFVRSAVSARSRRRRPLAEVLWQHLAPRGPVVMPARAPGVDAVGNRSEEHTSELQSRGLTPYAAFC